MTLNEFLARLDELKWSNAYRLDRVRDGVMVMVAVPGERWEVEFMDDGGIEVERFVGAGGVVVGEDALDELWAIIGVAPLSWTVGG